MRFMLIAFMCRKMHINEQHGTHFPFLFHLVILSKPHPSCYWLSQCNPLWIQFLPIHRGACSVQSTFAPTHFWSCSININMRTVFGLHTLAPWLAAPSSLLTQVWAKLASILSSKTLGLQPSKILKALSRDPTPTSDCFWILLFRRTFCWALIAEAFCSRLFSTSAGAQTVVATVPAASEARMCIGTPSDNPNILFESSLRFATEYLILIN